MCPALKDANAFSGCETKRKKKNWQNNFRAGSGFPSWALDWSATQRIALQTW